MRGWRKLGYSGESSTSRKTLSRPDRGRRGIEKPPPNFVRCSENDCYMTYFESLLRFRATCPRSPLFTASPSILISRPLTLRFFLSAPRRCTFLKLHRSRMVTFLITSFFFLHLLLPRIRVQSELCHTRPSPSLFCHRH